MVHARNFLRRRTLNGPRRQRSRTIREESRKSKMIFMVRLKLGIFTDVFHEHLRLVQYEPSWELVAWRNAIQEVDLV